MNVHVSNMNMGKLELDIVNNYSKLVLTINIHNFVKM